MSEKLSRLQRFYATYLEFHQELFNIQLVCMKRLAAIVPFEKLNQIDIVSRFNQQLPILGEDNFIFKDPNTDAIFESILPLIKQYFYRSKEQLLRIAELYNRRKLPLRSLIIDQITGNKSRLQKLASKYDIPAILIEKLVEYVSEPYLELCSELLTKKLSQYHWDRPFCPICGNRPTMALVNEREMKRKLWCRICDTTWSFSMNGCPFCSNQDLSNLKVIFLSDRKPIRIEACELCRNYIKIINEEIAEPIQHLSVKNVETLSLDLLAYIMGYQTSNSIKFYLETF